jgi:hypothetical protein
VKRKLSEVNSYVYCSHRPSFGDENYVSSNEVKVMYMLPVLTHFLKKSVRSLSSSVEMAKLYSFNLLSPSGFFTYHQILYSTILHSACFALRVLYGFQNKQQLLLYTPLTD